MAERTDVLLFEHIPNLHHRLVDMRGIQQPPRSRKSQTSNSLDQGRLLQLCDLTQRPQVPDPYPAVFVSHSQRVDVLRHEAHSRPTRLILIVVAETGLFHADVPDSEREVTGRTGENVSVHLRHIQGVHFRRVVVKARHVAGLVDFPEENC